MTLRYYSAQNNCIALRYDTLRNVYVYTYDVYRSPFTLLPCYPVTLLPFYPVTLLPFYPFTLLPFYPFYPFYPFTLLPVYPFTLFTRLPVLPRFTVYPFFFWVDD